jgi:ATP-dependent DNA helicase RecQ
MHQGGESPDALDLARAALRARFGFDDFREGQTDVVARLLAGRSAVAIFPTGAGKSLCYQLPALLLDGLTLVVSPLIALMKDQIDFLTARGIDAARLDSSLEADDVRDVFSRLRSGTLKILYVAPERLANERFLASLGKQRIALIAVDEAHCISEWGHNFRPDYLRLASVAKLIHAERILALTATATPDVARQIAMAFDIPMTDVVRTGFYRPNLSLMVTPTAPGEPRDQLLLRRLRQRSHGPTIVYVTLQRTAERVASLLLSAGFDAAAYHAGLDAEVRNAVQDRFMQSTGMIVVATIAFGMGIDKRDLRAVYHYNLPKSLENYAQEIGRAGRDGLDSVCELLACADDRVTLENFTFGDTPTPEAIESIVAEVLNSDAGLFDVGVLDLSFRHDTRPLVVETILTYLQLLGQIESVGAFYTEYKFREMTSLKQAITRFDERRSAFLTELFSYARAAKIWRRIDLHEASQQMNEPRDRLVAAINYLGEQGVLEVQAAGARQAYRRLTACHGATPALIEQLAKRFADREARDVVRTNDVIAFADHDGCRTRVLVAHFGEPFDRNCGHCGWCRNHRPGPMPPLSHRPLGGDRDASLIRSLRAEGHDALASPRQMARFLCGIASPAASRAKLGKHSLFGAWDDVPFAEVLAFVEPFHRS